MKHKTLTLLLAMLMSMTASMVCADEHEYVDLGLPSGTLWATCNVGAYAPEETGNFYAWGEITAKTVYEWSNYKWCNGSETTMTKYCCNSSYGTVDNKAELELADDAAYVNWGTEWCMPTNQQWVELADECTWTWKAQNGVNGYEVVSKINGKSIFLPATGWRSGSKLVDANSTTFRGCYWSNILIKETCYYASFLSIYSNKIEPDVISKRFCGHTIRPVRLVPTSNITLNYETYTLYKIGKTVQLEASILPENASRKQVTWKSLNEAVCVVTDGLVIATGEGTTVVSATTADGEHVAYCSIKVELIKCATPTITYKNGKLTFASDKEGIQFVSSIADTDIKAYNSAEIDLSVTYTIRVHATHPDYYDSEEAVGTLCWIEVEPKSEGVETAVKEISALPVLIQSNNGTLHITGAEDGSPVSVYTTSGQLLGTGLVHGNEASVGTNLHDGIAVVKIGNRAVKVLIK